MASKATQATPKKRHRWTDDELIAGLKSAGGMVHLAARQLGCAPSVIYRRLKQSARLREVLDDQREEFLDIAEASLKRKVIEGDGWAVCFTLKTLGKARGYVERREVTGADGERLIPRDTLTGAMERAQKLAEKRRKARDGSSG